MSVSLVDSHCHLDRLDFHKLGGNLDHIIKIASEQNVTHMLCVSITLEDFPAVRRLAHQYPNVYASVGVHPNEIDGRDPSIEELVKIASEDEKIIAIGETGLDYFRSEGDLEWQRQRFRNHIRAAIASNKPLIIHTRDAEADTLAIMVEERAHQIGGVMHCFTGSLAMAKAAIEMGFYISFSGIITFNNTEKLQDVARQVPCDRLLVETDAPYLTPVPQRGKANHPANTRLVAEQMARLRGESIDTIMAQTTQNFTDLFKIEI